MRRLYYLLVCALALSCGAPKDKDTAQGAQPGDIIPAPVEYALTSGSVESAKVAQLPQKVKISEKALNKRLNGRELTDWQLKGAYWLEVGKKAVKIEAADEEGVFYARQSLKMLAALTAPLPVAPSWTGHVSSTGDSCWM